MAKKENLPASVEDVLITHELQTRPPRTSDLAAENAALRAIAEEMAENPSTALQTLAEQAMKLCGGNSAGVTILEQSGKEETFRWQAIAGQFAANLYGTFQREASPSGTALDRDRVLLFREPSLFFEGLRAYQPMVHEALLAPFRLAGKPIGTLWAIAHTPEFRFDSEDARLLESLAQLAAPAYSLIQRTVTANDLRASRSAALNLMEDAVQSRRALESSERELRREINDRAQTEAALRASEERFRQFAENSADVFWILDARTMRLEYLNPMYQKIFGQAHEVLMHDREKRLDLVLPEDREAAAAGLDRALAGQTYVRNYRIVRPNDGEMRWIRDTLFPIRDEEGRIIRIAGVAQDVSEDRQRTEELRQSEERFRYLVEGAKEYAIFLMDPTNTIVHWNTGAERVFGWTAKEAIGQLGRLIFTPEDRKKKQEEKEIENALRHGTAPDRRWHMRKDGSRIWVDGVMHRIDDEETGALRGFAKIARDATTDREAERKLQRAHDELERRVRQRTAELWAANAELQDEISQRAKLEQEILLISEREKRRIGQDLHDSLCQELAAAAFLLEMTAKKLKKKNVAEAKTVTEAAQIVNANVGLARDLARGLHPIDLGGGLPAALRELAFRSHGKVSCRFEGARGVDVREPNAALNLYRIGQEAVANALKHGRPSEIVISLRRDVEGVVLSVWDNGRGFRPEKNSKGMGLHIMSYRANAIGARCTIQPNPGRGTCVRCVLPEKAAKKRKTRPRRKRAPKK